MALILDISPTQLEQRLSAAFARSVAIVRVLESMPFSSGSSRPVWPVVRDATVAQVPAQASAVKQGVDRFLQRRRASFASQTFRSAFARYMPLTYGEPAARGAQPNTNHNPL